MIEYVVVGWAVACVVAVIALITGVKIRDRNKTDEERREEDESQMAALRAKVLTK